MKRHNQILIAVLIVQVVLSVVVFWPESAATGESGLVFPGLETEAVVGLTVEDDEDNVVTLRRTTEGWVVPDVDDYPAERAKIDEMLDKIVALDTGRLVTRTDASHKRLRLASDDFLRRVTLETADGATHVLYVGSGPTYSAAHFRLDGQDEVYLANDLSAWGIGATVTSWIDTTYFSIDEVELARVTLENDNGTFVFSKDVGGEWTLAGLEAGEELNTGAVSTIINRLTSVVLLRPLGLTEDPSYGLDDPSAVVTMEAGGRTITLLVGAQHPDDNSYAVKVSESPYYVRVAGHGIQALVENTRDDFLQQPTPTPEAESETD